MYTLTWELQEIRFVAEDQVVVGNKVEEPNIQLLCIVALRIHSNKRHVDRQRGFSWERFSADFFEYLLQMEA